jgi:trimeric autotransporter adhesin
MVLKLWRLTQPAATIQRPDFTRFFSNTNADNNTAYGYEALLNNTGPLAMENTAVGFRALRTNNMNGHSNTGVGHNALGGNSSGSNNTAIGVNALGSNMSTSFNTAVGEGALFNNTGAGNIAVGATAGQLLTTGNFNIDIGNAGKSAESSTIRIGQVQTATFIAGIDGATVTGVAVVVNGFGQLGTAPSSQRFKEEIKPMDSDSEVLLALKPVTFRYKKHIDPAGTSQFGLVAEEVEKVNPDLVVRDKEGKPYSVRYDAVNAMLLNEFLKEHRKVEALQASFVQQQKDFQATAAQQQKQIEALTAGLQKVSAQIELSKPAPQTVVNTP